jgi:hypothetical protein
MGQNTKIRRQQATAVLSCPPAASAGPTSPPRTRIGRSANHNERQSAQYMRRAYAHATHCTRQSADIRPGPGAAIVACPPAAALHPRAPPASRAHAFAEMDITTSDRQHNICAECTRTRHIAQDKVPISDPGRGLSDDSGVPARRNRVPHQPAAHTHSPKVVPKRHFKHLTHASRCWRASSLQDARTQGQGARECRSIRRTPLRGGCPRSGHRCAESGQGLKLQGQGLQGHAGTATASSPRSTPVTGY